MTLGLLLSFRSLLWAKRAVQKIKLEVAAPACSAVPRRGVSAAAGAAAQDAQQASLTEAAVLLGPGSYCSGKFRSRGLSYCYF